MNDLDLNIPLVEVEDNEPFIGQTFGSQEEAFVFYDNYGRQHGFFGRKDRSDTRHGQTVRRDFCCHRQGKPTLKVIDPSKQQRNRESSRCDCKAHMRITLKRYVDIFPDEWHVTKFVKEHNHNLLSPEEMCLHPANRNITIDDEKQILLYKEAGLSVKQIIRLMELQKKVNHGDLSFIDKDVRNLFTRVKKAVGADDAKSLIQFMKSKKEENVKFQFRFTVDEESRLEHLFWSHAESFDWYQKYGDVVVFDTTYKVNAYDMPCGFFVGINNHGKTILFGCALLRNEKTSTFKWLMKTFVTMMNKPPKTIITDQDPWMSEAVASEMPTTKHSFCIWHITSKFSCWFTALLRHDYQKWCADFYMLYKMVSPEEFEHNWPIIIDKYNLRNNKHVQGLHKIRHFWAPAYLRDYFFGGMITTGRSESLNAFIKRFVSSHTCLKDFANQLDLAIQEISQGSSYNKLIATLRPTSLKSKSPLEEHAFKVLTPFAFKKIQEEFGLASQYSLPHVEGNEFIVKHFHGGNNRNHKVFWDGEIALCSCKNFEFWGILCRHILRVFLQRDCYKIPPSYLPLRWSSDALQISTCGNQNVPRDAITMTGHESLLQDIESVVEVNILCPPKSTTKGRPKKKRDRSGKELAMKQTKCCSICKERGHTKPKCHKKENIIVLNEATEGVFNDSRKNAKKASDLGLNPIFTLKF